MTNICRAEYQRATAGERHSLPNYVARLLAQYPFISHPLAEHVLDELEFLFVHRVETGRAVGERFAGPSNVGKSTTMLEMLRRHPPVRLEDGWRHPVVYIHLPERAKLSHVYTELLRALGDPAADRGTETEKRGRMRCLVEHAGVKLLFVDEPHHLTEAKTDGARLGTTQLAKVLVDIGLTVIFGGVHSVDVLASASPELARRFPGRLFLRPYDVGSQEGLMALESYADAVGKGLTRVEAVQLGSDDRWFSRLAVVSNGFVGFISQLVLQAESRAHQSGDDILTFKHFAKAWTRFEYSLDPNLEHLRRGSSTRLMNVFEMEDDAVAGLLGRMLAKSQ